MQKLNARNRLEVVIAAQRMEDPSSIGGSRFAGRPAEPRRTTALDCETLHPMAGAVLSGLPEPRIRYVLTQDDRAENGALQQRIPTPGLRHAHFCARL